MANAPIPEVVCEIDWPRRVTDSHEIDIAKAKLPVTYDAARSTLARCVKIDECKMWADKAKALAAYARMAGDDTLQSMAARIKARAVRRCGELLRQSDARGAHRKSGGTPTSSQRDAAASAGMSKDQQVTAVRLAKVPADQFEKVVECERPATITEIAKMGVKARRPDAPERVKQTTEILGILRRFTEFCKNNPPCEVAAGLSSDEVEDACRRAAQIRQWLQDFAVEAEADAR